MNKEEEGKIYCYFYKDGKKYALNYLIRTGTTREDIELEAAELTDLLRAAHRTANKLNDRDNAE